MSSVESLRAELCEVERLLGPLHRAAASVHAIPAIAAQREALSFRRERLLRELNALTEGAAS